jgi:hypothetical protein
VWLLAALLVRQQGKATRHWLGKPMAQARLQTFRFSNLDWRESAMKKKTTIVLQPEVDDLCDLIARIITRPLQGEEGRADETQNRDDHDDDAPTALTPQKKQ